MSGQREPWVYNDPVETYDITEQYLLSKGGTVKAVEDAIHRSVGFEHSDGQQILYFLEYTTGSPKSEWYNPFTPILLDPVMRDHLAECLNRKVCLGNAHEPQYSRYSREIEEYRQSHRRPVREESVQ